MNCLNYIDLFAGAGGLSEGFKKNGFNPIAHVEMDYAACQTLRTRAAFHYLKEIGNTQVYESYLKGEIRRGALYDSVPHEIHDSVINMAISEENNSKIFDSIDAQLLRNDIKKVDLIIGGPPCQAYSLVGRARSEHNMKRDPRNFLYVQYANFLERYGPRMFVFENVLGLLSAGGGIYLQNMERLFKKKGYTIKIFKVKAENFGVLQKRRRLIILGWRDDCNTPNIPNLDHYDGGLKSIVANVLSDLPKLEAGTGTDKYTEYACASNDYLFKSGIRNGSTVLTQHVARPHTNQDKAIYKIAVEKWKHSQRLNYNDLPDELKTHRNTSSFFDRFKVVADNIEASQTIVAHIAKDGHYYIHPDLHQNRSLSVREAARLQSFPDDFYFEGAKEGANRTAAFKQIGNAVPPLMANFIAKELKLIL